jgi:hypothetical protein
MADCHQVSNVAGGGFTLKNHIKNRENGRRPPSDRTSTVSYGKNESKPGDRNTHRRYILFGPAGERQKIII